MLQMVSFILFFVMHSSYNWVDITGGIHSCLTNDMDGLWVLNPDMIYILAVVLGQEGLQHQVSKKMSPT